ncbi:MAG: hypothetical protein K8U57_07960 [Planctomycetes bacterium]|nr:hypothetical protein [Planctomycetota bacterium]
MSTAVGTVTHATTSEIRIEAAEQVVSVWVVLAVVTLIVCAIGSGLVGTGFALGALGSWRRLGRSSRLTRWAWILWVLGPLPVLLMPISHVFRLEGQDALQTSTTQVVYLLTVTVPALFALLPGALSASLVLKRFIPESWALGQITLLASSACIVVYLLPLGLLAQLAFQPQPYFGLVLLASSPVIPLLAIRWLRRCNTSEQAARLVGAIGLFQGVLAVLGAALLIRWVGNQPQLRAWVAEVDPVWVLGMIARVLASKWLTTVVVADLLISMLFQGREASLTIATKVEGETLARKIDALGKSLRSTERINDRTRM